MNAADRYWVLHEEALVRALGRVWVGEITPGEALAELEEHAECEDVAAGGE